MFFNFKKKMPNQKAHDIEINVSRQVINEREKIVKSIMEQKKLPILVIDKSWYNVKELIINEVIEQKEKELVDYLKEQGSLNNALKENHAVKQNLLKKVLEVSEAINSKGDSKREAELDTLHQAITKINNDVESQETRLEEVQGLIESTNRDLTEEAVALSYTYMESYKETSSQLQEEIDILRAKLLEKATEKKQYDQKITTLYHYLHNIVGYKHIDKLDKKLGDS
ncbi:hypothetical protein [Niameybacter massiliensis]|uniref:hypothetical protein n=1 Tax=Niameybacter massiliensis TaxID=1658108 RepID=UPI0006B55BB0|nr:hypothetical protein [Niameybacter massiliensis]